MVTRAHPARRGGPAAIRARAWRVGLALVIGAVGAVVLFGAVNAQRGGGGGGGGGPPLRGAELPADALVDSIGVVVHLSYGDTAYGRQPEVLARLRELGVGHIREAMPTPPVGPLADGLRAARQQGLRATLGTGDPNVDPAVAVRDSLTVMSGGIDAFEGPNELDTSADPTWSARLTAYMPKLSAAVKSQAPGVPLIGPSFVNQANRRLVGQLPGLLNGHPYPGGRPPEPVLRDALLELEKGGGGRGVVFTETGYHNALGDSSQQPPVSEVAAAVYLPRLLVTAFGAGVRRTFVYELLDEKPDPALSDLQQHFGLLRNDLSPKPAFSAIRTLIVALRDAGAAERRAGRLGWRLRTGDGGVVERLEMVRRDGSHVIALWRPVSVWDVRALAPVDPGTLPVQLILERPAREIAVWRPSLSTAPVVRRRATARVPLALGGDLVLVSVR